MYRSVHNGSFTSLSEVYSAALPNDDILPVTTALLNAFNEFLLPSDILPSGRGFPSFTHQWVRLPKVSPGPSHC